MCYIDNAAAKRNELRSAAKRKRRLMKISEVSEKSICITKKLMLLSEYFHASTIMTYLSAFNEVDTKYIIADAQKKNKEIAVPVTYTDSLSIEAAVFYGYDDMIEGAYGIKTPKNIVPVNKSSIDIIIVPGVVFDLSGNRIGFGKGYYDRFLADYRGIKIGLCYEYQLMQNVYPQEHDIPMDIIITERRVIFCDKKI